MSSSSAVDDADASSALSLVLQLSATDIPSQQRRACETILESLQQGEFTTAGLLELDCLPPLLLLAQSAPAPAPVVRSASASVSSIAAASVPDVGASLSVLAHRVLHQLQTESKLRLFEAGWSVATDPQSGRALYRCTATGEQRFVPPTNVAVPALEDGGEAEPEWISSLILELPMLCSPARGRGVGAGDEWPAHVRHHRPRAAPSSSSAAHTDAITVVDIRPESEAGNGGSSGVVASESAEGVSRQLVIGTWQGIGCSFRETEADLSYSPGTHLEAHYTATMAGTALLAAAAMDESAAGAGAATSATAPPSLRSPKRVLVIGLGGGALVSFLAQYCPHWTVEVVELNADVARVAERFFGVRFTQSMQQGEADKPSHDAAAPAPTPLSLATDAGFAAPFAGPPCELHVCDALSFVRQPHLAGQFDVVLLDVYTSGVFPSSLLHDAFFADLKALLRPSSSTSSSASNDDSSCKLGGVLLVNAGVGEDRVRVEQCARRTFGEGQCRMLLNKVRMPAGSAAEQSAASAADTVTAAASAAGFDATQESCVLLAGHPSARFREDFSVLTWRKRVEERHPDQLQPLPFELQGCKSSDADGDAESDDAAASSQTTLSATTASSPPPLPSTVISWRGVQLDKLAARRERQAERAQEKQRTQQSSAAVKMASKNDSAWSLFD